MEFKIAYRLFVGAMRAREIGDLRLATIEATSAMEVAVFFFIKSNLLTDPSKELLIPRRKPSAPAKRINSTNFTKHDQEINLNKAMNTLLPQLITLDQGMMDGANRIRDLRNVSIHDPISFSASSIDVDIKQVRAFLDTLAANS